MSADYQTPWMREIGILQWENERLMRAATLAVGRGCSHCLPTIFKARQLLREVETARDIREADAGISKTRDACRVERQ